MTYSDMIGIIDDRYEFLCEKILYSKPLSASDIERLQYTNEELHQALFFQDFLRLRTIAAIEIYHNYLRDILLKTVQIDIGEFAE